MRRRCRHYRRHDPLAAAGPLSGTRHDVGLRLRYSGTIAARIVRPLLRYLDADVHRALPLALHRARGALEGCVRLGRRLVESDREKAENTAWNSSSWTASRCATS